VDSRVHEHPPPVGHHQERGVTSVHIDGVDLKGLSLTAENVQPHERGQEAASHDVNSERAAREAGLPRSLAFRQVGSRRVSADLIRTGASVDLEDREAHRTVRRFRPSIPQGCAEHGDGVHGRGGLASLNRSYEGAVDTGSCRELFPRQGFFPLPQLANALADGLMQPLRVLSPRPTGYRLLPQESTPCRSRRTGDGTLPGPGPEVLHGIFRGSTIRRERASE